MEQSRATIPVDLNRDNDVVDVKWFSTQEEVFSQLRLMMKSGWRISPMGLTSDGDDGPVVARPIKIKGVKRYTGIGIWKVSNHDADNY